VSIWTADKQVTDWNRIGMVSENELKIKTTPNFA
jgi:hypothetical protein